MLLRVSPDALASGAARLGDDGPLLRGLVALLTKGRRDVAGAVGQHRRLAAALERFMADESAVLGTLADSAELLSHGLAAAARAYRDAEDAAITVFGGQHG
ncbi:MAG: hypothetical protein ACOYBY_02355 [Dermatophilaceae bacterium]